MNTGRLAAGMLLLPFLFTIARAQAPQVLPVLDEKPFPQIDAGGPSAAVTALAFSADGETLYAAGLDKVVRVWTLQKGNFVLKSTYRVPIGPGNTGALNAVALSPDGAWIAMAGRAPIRGEAGFRHAGVIVETPILSPEQNQDAGVIYVASTANPAGGKVLRGHRGEVWGLAFAPAPEDKPPLLVSAAVEREGTHRFGGLRLWDVAAGKLLAEYTRLPAKPTRPGLAVWHTGPGLTQVRVAVAWPYEDAKKRCYLLLWDTGLDSNALQMWDNDRFGQVAALLGQQDGVNILTGGLGPRTGRLRVWHFSGEPASRARLGAELMFPPRDRVQFLPVSLAVVPSKGGVASYGAVVLQPSADGDFRLALVDLRANQIVANLPLKGSDTTRLPAVAARGRYVAVAATRDQAIQVYALADLLQAKTEPKAVLLGEGVSPRRVAFVDKGRGLWLSEDGRSRSLSGGLVFDLDKRQVRVNNGPGLASDAPQSGEWSLSIDPDRKAVRVRRGQMDLPAVRLQGKDEVITTAALRPASLGRAAVLAVAYTERDASRTLIMLCDPATGKPHRLLVGHLQDVRDLAFSASLPLLASVGDDQTVCVWGLADLDQAVGQVAGLRVAEEAGKVVVRGVQPGSPVARAELAEGDVLEKFGAAGGEAKPVKDAASLLLTISAHRPGDQVEVTVAGKGTVKLPIERGIDQRKPLFSIFLLRRSGLPEWVGWSPAGPYDHSSPVAEAHLGWHTNTGDPAAPVSYAAAREYRKDYYREGILRYLSVEADLGRALQKWGADHPAQAPQAALRPVRPDAALPGERANEYRVRQPLAALRIGINEDYPLDDKHVLRWRIARADGGKVKGDAADLFGQALRDGKEWQADLSGVEWRRGEYRLRLGLQAPGDGPERTSETVSFRFQPSPPAVTLRLGGTAVHTTEQKPFSVNGETLAVQAAVQVPLGEKVVVQFVHSRNGVPQPDAPLSQVQIGPGAVAQEFKLQEGLNRLAVRATNSGALAGHEDEETADAEAWVSYKAPRELPPRFTALRLEPPPEIQRHDGKELWVVSRPTVRLVGKIEATGVLVQADWSAGGNPKSVLPSGERRAMEFVANLDLKAGQMTPVVVRAKSTYSDLNMAEHRVVFYPPLPTVLPDALDSPDFITDTITLAGTVQAVTSDPFDLSFRVTSIDGKEASFKPDLDLRAGRWKVALSLFPGSNTVETVVGNKWRGARAIERVLMLRYRRPPEITAFPAEVDAVGTNKVKLLVAVTGPTGRPLTAFKVDGNPVPFEPGKPETRGGRWVWTVQLPEVFVNDGDRDLEKASLQAISDEGESRAVSVRIVHKKLPRPPHARFVNPAASDTARGPEYPVTFRVESERPLQRVEIRRGSEVLYQADLKKVERAGPLYILQEDAVVTLVNGANVLELIAVNTEGRSPRAEVIVSYTEPAVLVRIDRIELSDDHGQSQEVLEPVYAANGDIVFPKAPRSLVWLVGRVRWSDPKARALDDRNLEIIAKVGDCRQFPVALAPRGKDREANVRAFRVPLVLIGLENRIKIELPSVGQQELSCREFDVACTAPVKNQRLHVLIVGVNVGDWAELKERVLDALAVDPRHRPDAQGEFQKPPFQRCILYHVLVGDVDRGKVEAQLVEINNEIARLKRQTGWLNDVVLIYYQGEDIVVPGKRERWLKTSRNFQFPKVPPQVFAIPCHALPRVPGVELLLLNVPWTPDVRVAERDWGGDPDAGFLRYACQDPTETCRPDPALLGLLQEAIRKKDRLGDIFNYVNELLGQQPTKFSHLVVLDPYQANRRISEPSR